MADFTTRVTKAARLAGTQLESTAPVLVRMLRRSIFGCVDDRGKERIALAQSLTTMRRAERSGLRFALSTLEDIARKRVDLTENKVTEAITDATAVSDPKIDTSYTTALAVVTAMGLTVARTTTLTNALIAMRDTNRETCLEAVTSAAKLAAKSGALRVINKAESDIGERVTELTDRVDGLTAAIAKEGERLGIRI